MIRSEEKTPRIFILANTSELPLVPEEDAAVCVLIESPSDTLVSAAETLARFLEPRQFPTVGFVLLPAEADSIRYLAQIEQAARMGVGYFEGPPVRLFSDLSQTNPVWIASMRQMRRDLTGPEPAPYMRPDYTRVKRPPPTEDERLALFRSEPPPLE